MKLSLPSAILVTFVFLWTAATEARAETVETDVVVYGATPGGIAAAVHAAREGLDVVLVQEDGHLGGLASGGLSNSDFKTYEALGGAFRELTQRVEAHYAETYGENSDEHRDCMLGGYYEPGVAGKAFEDMLRESGVRVELHRRLTKAEIAESKGRKRVASLEFEPARGGAEALAITPEISIDGTYEGDLVAAAGVPYRLGCEAYSEFEEHLARDFDEPNDYVQTYNFRPCLTEDPDNRIPIPKPEGYDRDDFAPMIDHIEEGIVDSFSQEQGSRPVLKVRRIANRKADFNDVPRSPVSLSIENVNHPWPEGSAEVRQGIYDIYRDHSLGLFWFLANDPEVPEDWREEMEKWGLPKDEFTDNDHWSPALYVREGRRMEGAYLFTENDTRADPDDLARAKLHPDSIAMGDYNHNCHGVYDPGDGQPTIGHAGRSIAGPFQVPYGVILPKSDWDGLLAPVPVSSSHGGFGVLRMEPTWMGLGQAAGVAAALSLKSGKPLDEVDVDSLQLRLHELGAKTVYVSDLGEAREVHRPGWDNPDTTFPVHLTYVPPRDPHFRAIQFLGTKGFFHGLIGPDDREKAKKPGRSTGQWKTFFPNHFVEPDRKMDAETLSFWEDKSVSTGLFEAAPDLGERALDMTRAEYLDAIFAAWLKNRTARG
ncbi:MAG: FAD-dependent oxidoreductase [Verrucomicrobiales bacterium]